LSRIAQVGCRIRCESARFATRTLELHAPGELDAAGIRGLARYVAAALRDGNTGGNEKHLLLAGPCALGALIGAGANAAAPYRCGTAAGTRPQWCSATDLSVGPYRASRLGVLVARSERLIESLGAVRLRTRLQARAEGAGDNRCTADETSRMLPLDRGALAIELDEILAGWPRWFGT
jgi:hypothetical protein